ncbi:MAG: hypothetical protein ACRDRO_26835 [Pseudonocardiaceae bacterium]
MPTNNQNASRSVSALRVLGRRVRRAYRDEVGSVEQALLVAWSAFGGTFGVTRAITYWLHIGHGPAGGGIVIGGRHLHHYNVGIALLAAVGAVVPSSGTVQLRSACAPAPTPHPVDFRSQPSHHPGLGLLTRATGGG